MNQGTDFIFYCGVNQVHGSAGARRAFVPWRNKYTQCCSQPLEVTASLVSLIGSCLISRIVCPSGSGQPPRQITR